MTSAHYDRPQGAFADGPQVALKILVAGGFGVGKTTLVGSVSEIRPLRTEEVLTDVSTGVDDLSGVEEIRSALDVDPDVPIVLCDVRKRDSAKEVLITLVEHAIRVG